MQAYVYIMCPYSLTVKARVNSLLTKKKEPNYRNTKTTPPPPPPKKKEKKKGEKRGKKGDTDLSNFKDFTCDCFRGNCT